MIRKEKFNQAHYAPHQIFVRARFMAYTKESYDDIALLLDYAEILPRFFVSEEDETEEFRKYLHGMTTHFPQFSFIFNSFIANSSPDKW
jgi:hypothetical protein